MKSNYSKSQFLFSQLNEYYIGKICTHEIEDVDDESEEVIEINKIVDNYLNETNLWFNKEDENSIEIHKLLWKLLESETIKLNEVYGNKQESKVTAFSDMLVKIMEGLRKIALRDDFIALYFSDSKMNNRQDSYTIIQKGFSNHLIGEHSVSYRVKMYLINLCDANGSIMSLETSKRLSLWQGMFRRELTIVDVIHGEKDQESRVRLCAAFNSPLQPDVLICTAIGSEGIDLHRNCTEIIHHDLPWNPAKLEQRIGRIDRVGSLSELLKCKIQIGIPFLEHNYEKFQYETLWSRAQRFEILMGEPDFDVDVNNEEILDEEQEGVNMNKNVMKENLYKKSKYDSIIHLPEEIINLLKMDLSLRSK